MSRALLTAALCYALLAIPGRAAAQGFTGYPLRLIDRPLTLPRWVVQPLVEVSLTNSSNVIYDSGADTPQPPRSGNGLSLSLGADVGLSPRVQMGLMLTIPVYPNASFGAFIVDLQYAISGNVNLRVDIGSQQANNYYPTNGYQTVDQADSLVLGAGFAIRARLTSKLAIVSGNNSVRGFDSARIVAAGPLNMLSGFTLSTQDIFTLGVWNEGGVALIGGSLHLPVGLLYQPIPWLALQFRTGYRMNFSVASDQSESSLAHYIPLAIDVIGSPNRHLDIGFTASLDGPVWGDAQNYLDVRKFDFWVAARF